MNVATKPALETTVAARIAGEDLACGDFVAVMNEIVELPSFLWNGASVALAPDEPVRIRYTARDAGQPYKVIGVCLPFVYAKTHGGHVIVLDTRQRQLVRLDQACGSAVWEKMKAREKNGRK